MSGYGHSIEKCGEWADVQAVIFGDSQWVLIALDNLNCGLDVS